MKVDIELEEKSNLGAKDKILYYCQHITKGYPVEVKNVTTSFSDGGILACMIHAKKPNLINPKKILESKDFNANLSELINTLEKDFNVPHLINPEDIIEEPEEKSMMTFLSYVIQGLEKFPTVSTGLTEDVVEEKVEEIIEEKPELPESVLSRFLSCGEGERSSKDAYYLQKGENWQPVKWNEYLESVKCASKSLIANNVEPNQRVLVISRSSPHSATLILSSQMVGAIPVPLFPDTRIEEIESVSNETKAKIAFVEGKEEFERLQKHRKALPTLERIILLSGEDGNGKDSFSWDEFLKSGESTDENQVNSRVQQLKPQDPALLLFRRLGSSSPKGILLNHSNILGASKRLSELTNSGENTKYLCMTSPADLNEQYFSIYVPIIAASKVYFGELSRTSENLRKVQPSVIFFPRKRWNNLSNALQKTLSFEKSKSSDKSQKESEREKEGLKDCSFAISVDGPLSKTDEEYFDQIECPVLPLFEEIETAGAITFSSRDCRKQGTSGKAIEGNTLEIVGDKDINGNGEIVVLSPNLFPGYFEDPNLTEKNLKEGKFYTGKLGKLDGEGFLCVLGAKEDQFSLENGTTVNPRDLESELREHPLIDDAVVFGKGRKNLVALLTIHPKELEQVAKANNMSPKDFSSSPLFNELVQNHVNAVNQRFPENQRVVKFKVLLVPFSVSNKEIFPEDSLNREAIAKNFSVDLNKFDEEDVQQVDEKLLKQLTNLKKHLNQIAFKVPNLENEMGSGFIEKFGLSNEENKSNPEGKEDISDEFIEICERRANALDEIVEKLRVKTREEIQKREELQEKNGLGFILFYFFLYLFYFYFFYLFYLFSLFVLFLFYFIFLFFVNF